MKTKTSELTGVALDWAVAKCEGLLGPDGICFSDEYCDSLGHDQDGDFTNDWAQGGPIIEREKINLRLHGDTDKQHSAFIWVNHLPTHRQKAPTPLIAAMRCYVASKLGDEVEIPEELK